MAQITNEGTSKRMPASLSVEPIKEQNQEKKNAIILPIGGELFPNTRWPFHPVMIGRLQVGSKVHVETVGLPL